jgi:hypothetical protein
MFDKLKEKKQRETVAKVAETFNALFSGVLHAQTYATSVTSLVEHGLKRGKITKADADAVLAVLRKHEPVIKKQADVCKQIPYCAQTPDEVKDWTAAQVQKIARDALAVFDALLKDLAKAPSSLAAGDELHPTKLAAINLNHRVVPNLRDLAAGKPPTQAKGALLPDPKLFA